MKSASSQDRKVKEVREILEGLQRYSEGDPPMPHAVGAERAPMRTRIVVVAAAIAGLVGIGGLAAFFWFRGNNPAAETLSYSPLSANRNASNPVNPANADQLQAALGHLSAGRVHAARENLQALATRESADAAWALARSYDPNYLRTLDSPDAPADVAEAKRWYRTWYAFAVKQGLVADSVSLERIIKSME